jgi:hypothetical protein
VSPGDGRRWCADDPRRLRALAIALETRSLSSEAQSLAMSQPGIDKKRVALARVAHDLAVLALLLEKEFER